MSLRESPFDNLKVPVSWSAGATLVIAMALALFLLVTVGIVAGSKDPFR